ncbi:hypothetical protein ACFX12_034151 [Malus domestica]
MRGGRFTGGLRFQRQRDFGGPGGSGAPLCRRCNNRHFGECRRGSNGCFTYGQMGHKLLNALKVSKDPSSLHSYHLHQPSKLQDLMVTFRLDDEVPTIIRATPLPTPHDSSNILRILSIRVGTLSIRDDLCLISHIQSVDLSGTKEDSPSRERLLLVVQDL